MKMVPGAASRSVHTAKTGTAALGDPRHQKSLASSSAFQSILDLSFTSYIPFKGLFDLAVCGFLMELRHDPKPPSDLRLWFPRCSL